jgi:predicted dehydrogenase
MEEEAVLAKRCLRMGMIGGGPGAFIGPVHRMGAELDGHIRLVAGAFSSNPERSREAGAAYGLAADRAYGSYEEMLAGEKARVDPIDFVAVVTPNFLHLPAASAALKGGFPVISDKPATANLEEALALEAAVHNFGLPYALTYTYTGYAMVRQARAMCRAGEIGHVRKVIVEYLQGWLTEPLEHTGHKQAAWRLDAAKAGLGGAIGDIGVHAFQLVEFVTGLATTEVCAALNSIVPGRTLDDDCSALLKLDGSVPAVLMASQVATGEGNGLRLRVYGDTGALDWQQELPNQLVVRRSGQPAQTYAAGSDYLTPEAKQVTRLPVGHPEGLIEAFANIYSEFGDAVRSGGRLSDTVPGIRDGVRGMRFVERAIESSQNRTWVAF